MKTDNEPDNPCLEASLKRLISKTHELVQSVNDNDVPVMIKATVRCAATARGQQDAQTNLSNGYSGIRCKCVLHPRVQDVCKGKESKKQDSRERGLLNRLSDNNKRTRKANGHGRSVASRKMRNKLDAGWEDQRMTKAERED